MKALVTGGTSGIGLAVARAMAAAGHQVSVLGRNPEALAAVAGFATPLAADIADRAALEHALAGQEPDILVNNAGMMPLLANFCDAALEDIERTIAVNLTATLRLTHAVVQGMRARGRGHVFFTGSTAGHAPFPNLAAYAASKAAIGGFAQSLRLDLAPFGIRVTEIVAGRVETGLYKDILSPEARAAMYQGGSAVQPQDVADMVLAVLNLPPHVDVARFDILPTRQATATGASKDK